jgi:hypothetical protein
LRHGATLKLGWECRGVRGAFTVLCPHIPK